MRKDLRIKISIDKKTGELKVVEGEFDKLNKRVKSASHNTNTFKNDLIGLAKGAVGIYAINEAFKATIKSGFNYNSQLENAKGGLVALAVAIQDKSIPVTERYSRANAEATKTLQKLQEINAATPHTLMQTNQIYKAMYVSMRSAGASSSDLIKLTKDISIASGAAGIEFNSLLAGVDGLATGTVLANSDLGRFLKGLGLTNEALKKSKNVTKLLLDKLKDFKAMDTMTVAVSNFTNTWQQMAGDITKPLFEKTKQDLKGFTKTLDNNRNDIVEFGRDTIRVGQLVANGYESIFTSSKIGYLEIALEFRKEIDAIDNYVMKTIVETNNYWADSWIGKKAGLSKMNFNPSTVDANALRTEIRASKNELIGIGLESDKLVKSIENDTVAQEKFNKKLKDGKKIQQKKVVAVTQTKTVKNESGYIKALQSTNPSENELYKIQIAINKTLRDRTLIGKEYGTVQTNALTTANAYANALDKQKLDIQKVASLKLEQQRIEGYILEAKKQGIKHDQLDKQLAKNLSDQAQTRIEKEKDINAVLQTRYNKGRANLTQYGTTFQGMKDAYDTYAKNIPTDFQNGMKLMTDSISGVENAFVDFVHTGKLSFTSLANSIIDDIVRISVQQSIVGMIGGSSGIGSAISGLFGATGGLIPSKGYATGGLLEGGSGVRDDLYLGSASGNNIFAMGGEYILNKSATNSIGVDTLNHMNSTGKAPSSGNGNVIINVENKSGTPIDMKKLNESIGQNGDKTISIVMNAIERNPDMRNAIKGIR